MTQTAAGELSSTTDDTSGVISHVTASFTPPDDSLLVAHCYCINGTGGGDVQSGMTLSGGGLTWTKRAGPNGGTAASYTSCHEIWTAPVVTGASMTLTYSHAGNVGADKSSAHIQVHSFITDGGGSCGFDGAPNLISEPNNGDDGPQSLALPAAAVSASYKTASRAYSSNGNDANAIHGTGWTELYDVTHAGYGCLQSQVITADANTDIDWDDIIAGGPQTAWNSSGIGIEVEELSGGTTRTASGTPSLAALTTANTVELTHPATGTPTLAEVTAAGNAAIVGEVTITDVDTDESWADGATGLPITGTGFV